MAPTAFGERLQEHDARAANRRRQCLRCVATSRESSGVIWGEIGKTGPKQQAELHFSRTFRHIGETVFPGVLDARPQLQKVSRFFEHLHGIIGNASPFPVDFLVIVSGNGDKLPPHTSLLYAIGFATALLHSSGQLFALVR